MTYGYKKPRRLNVVSLLLLLCALAAGYLAYKFVPVYWQARQVDAALDELKLPAAYFPIRTEEVREAEADKLVDRAIKRLHEMGLKDMPDQPVEVWFSPDYTELHARYRVVVTHPALLSPTVLTMERVRPIPKR